MTKNSPDVCEGEHAVVYHIAEPTCWNAQAAEYNPDSLHREGFIHLSTAEQLFATASRYYVGRTDLLVLSVQVSLLDQDLVFENLLGGEELFPHYYAALPVTAVIGVVPLQLHSNGCFSADIVQTV